MKKRHQERFLGRKFLSRPLVLLGLGLLAPLRAMAGAQECDARLLLDAILGPNQALYKDWDKRTSYFYWGRLRHALEATDEATYAKVFGQVSPEDLHEISWSVQTGALKVKPQEAQFIEDLDTLVRDHGPVFWQAHENRANAVLEILRKVDASHDAFAGRDETALYTARALGNTENELMRRAVGEGVRSYPGSGPGRAMKRFVFPLHDRVQKIYSFNNYARKRLQHIYRVDEVVVDVMASEKQKGVPFSSDQVRDLEGLLTDTSGQLGEIRKEIASVYGQELSLDKPIPEEKIDVFKIYGRVKGKNLGKKWLDVARTGEHDLDVLEDRVNDARARKGLPKRSIEEFNPVELQLRHAERDRKMTETRNAYRRVLESESRASYEVHRHWETQESDGTDREGNPKFKTVVHDVWETHVPTYEEILNDDYEGPKQLYVVNTRGLDELRAATKALRASENPYRESMHEFESFVEGIVERHPEAIKDPKRVREALTQIESARAKAQSELAALKEYEHWNAAQVRGQWALDSFEHFKSRAAAMALRYQNLDRHLENLHEQVRRLQKELTYPYHLPDRSVELGILRKRRDFNYAVKSLGAAAAAGGAAAYYLNQDEANATAREAAAKLKALLGLGRQ